MEPVPRRREWSWASRLTQPERFAPDGFRALVAPVYRGSTTLFDDAASVRDTWNPDEAAYTYGQYGTPTAAHDNEVIVYIKAFSRLLRDGRAFLRKHGEQMLGQHP